MGEESRIGWGWTLPLGSWRESEVWNSSDQADLDIEHARVSCPLLPLGSVLDCDIDLCSLWITLLRIIPVR